MSKIVVDPHNVKQEQAGRCTRSWFVRLPEAATADDVKDPAIWSKVQQTRAPLQKHDEVYAVGFAEDFAVLARVTQATREAVTLAFVKHITFPERTTPLFSDETYRVVWNGTGYQVERIKDGATMGAAHGSEALAIRHIRNLYPQQVS
ncbi:MAG: hypothetical protein ACQEUZ_01865 [Pseudomonadota bacterium]